MGFILSGERRLTVFNILGGARVQSSVGGPDQLLQ